MPDSPPSQGGIGWVPITMKLTFNPTELKNAMAIVSKAIAPKSSLPILAYVKFSMNSDGVLLLTGANNENTLTVACPVSGVEDFREVALYAALLNSALSTLPNAPIDIEVKDNGEAVLTYATGHFSFAVLPVDEYPEPPYMPEGAQQIALTTDVIKSAMKTCKPFCAHDELRPVMNGVCMDLVPNVLTFAASDGHRLVRKAFPSVSTEGKTGTLIISQPTAALLDLMPREASLTVTFTDNYAQFDCEGYSLSARLIEGRFPNYNSVIPTGNPYHVEASRADLMAAIRRISAMGSKSSELLNFGVQSDLMGRVASIQAEDRDFSTSGYETIPVESNIDRPFHIGFKGSILLALLATHTADRVRIALADPTRAGVVTDIDGDHDLLTLLMPMMLND